MATKNEKPTVRYRGWDIEFDESDGVWRLDLDGKYIHNMDIKKVKAKVNDFEKGKIKGVTGIIREGYSYGKGDTHLPYQAVEISSITAEGDIWITNREGRRSKLYRADTIYAVTKENKKRLSKLRTLNQRIEKLNEEKHQLTEQLEVLDLSAYGIGVDETEV